MRAALHQRLSRGDGNLHPLIMFDASRGESERTKAFAADILELCVAVRWHALREQTHTFFPDPTNSGHFRCHPTRLFSSWGLHYRVGRRTALDTRPGAGAHFLAAAFKAGAHATLFRSTSARDDVFTPLVPALGQIHRKLKRRFDPEGILNAGREYADL